VPIIVVRVNVNLPDVLSVHKEGLDSVFHMGAADVVSTPIVTKVPGIDSFVLPTEVANVARRLGATSWLWEASTNVPLMGGAKDARLIIALKVHSQVHIFVSGTVVAGSVP